MSPPDGNSDPACSIKRRCTQCGLRRACLGAGCFDPRAPAAGLDRLHRLVEPRAPLAAGQSLFQPGDRLQAVYIVRAGLLKTCSEQPDGSVQVLGFHLPGDLLGLDALGGGRHSCHAVALERARVCALRWDVLQRLAAELPGLQRRLMTAIGAETLATHRHLSMLGCEPPRRLALFLRELTQRRVRLSLDPDLLQLSMTREDIASFLGMAEETICRQFHRLHEDGILEVHRRTVRILDQQRLAHPPPAPRRGVSAVRFPRPA
jgi:CRP/FNR family transcriptional regulator, anaerobic regulatory protein